MWRTMLPRSGYYRSLEDLEWGSFISSFFCIPLSPRSKTTSESRTKEKEGRPLVTMAGYAQKTAQCQLHRVLYACHAIAIPATVGFMGPRVCQPPSQATLAKWVP